MTRITAGDGVVTQINIFPIKPDRVDELIDVLKEAAESVRDVLGWISINLHVALDRTQVANYAQCESKHAWDQVMAILYAKGFIDRIVAIAVPRPCLYEVAWTLSREDESIY
ncbi:MAG TPA: antibiotic biosynthesis monooxygenase [Kofleriaceae bacterium]